jgi:hypothetical protein
MGETRQSIIPGLPLKILMVKFQQLMNLGPLNMREGLSGGLSRVAKKGTAMGRSNFPVGFGIVSLLAKT